MDERVEHVDSGRSLTEVERIATPVEGLYRLFEPGFRLVQTRSIVQTTLGVADRFPR